MIRVFAWIFRFVNNCIKGNIKNRNSELSQTEIENSETGLIHLTQKCYLTNEKVLKFDTFIDKDKILRVKTKITNREDDKSFLYPILLPGKCQFTKLLVKSIHLKKCHAGTNLLQTILRERFFVIGARKAIKSIVYNCLTCKRFKVKNMSSEPAPLPSDRVTDCAVFEVVGIDLAGPLFLKTGERFGLHYLHARTLEQSTLNW